MKPLRFLLVFCLLTAAAMAQSGAKGERYVKDELLVKFRTDLNRSKASDAAERLGLISLENLGISGWKRVKIGKGRDPKRTADALRLDPDVEVVQPNFYYRLQATPNDPEWSSVNLYGLPKISAPAAWDLTVGSASVVVANIDTGMRYTHEDLAANMWTNPDEIQGNGVDDDGNGFADDYYGYDFFDNDADPMDEHGHGTHVGGTIGAVGNNALGVVGVNWNVRIMAIKIFSATAQGTTSAMVVNAYSYVRMLKERGVNIRVTNNSYSGTDESDGDLALKEGIDSMGKAGILNVFAAGNDGWNNDTAATPAYPAAHTSPSILAIASSGSDDARSNFSNYGAIGVDLAAPGTAILSTTRSSDSSYGVSSGTSMASPHVAGAAALLSAYNPSLSSVSLKATLMNSVDSLTGWEATPTKTNGRLNVFKALQNQTVCTLQLARSSVIVSRKGGYVEIAATSGANCDFPIEADRRWIRVQNGKVLSGSNSIRVFIDPSQLLSRTGVLTVGGQRIDVQQGSPVFFPK